MKGLICFFIFVLLSVALFALYFFPNLDEMTIFEFVFCSVPAILGTPFLSLRDEDFCPTPCAATEGGDRYGYERRFAVL